MYAAMTHSPGCLPDTAEDLPTFDTAAEAWCYLADGLSDYDGWTLEDPEDEAGPSRRSDLALALEENERVSDQLPITGTVYGPDGYCYTVEVSEDED